MTRFLPLFSILALLLASCSDENNVLQPAVPVNVHGLYIVNEGNFQRSNSTLSFFVPGSGAVYTDVFRSVNGRDLGDTGYSITMHNGRAYIVVNGSNRIEVIDGKSHKLVKTIQSPPGASPRFIVFAPDGTGYISNLYTNDVSIYDDSVNTITGSIPVGNNPEELLIQSGHLFVANSGFGNGNTVSVIDLSTRTVVKTLPVGDGPSALASLSSNAAVALCTGAYNDFSDPNDDTPGMLFFIDTKTLAVTDSLVLGGHPQRIVLDGSGNLFTVQSGGIQKVELGSNMRTDSFIPGSFYSIAWDAERNQMYATNPLDYAQPGRLEVYGMDGKRRASYAVGIIPGAMGFTK